MRSRGVLISLATAGVAAAALLVTAPGAAAGTAATGVVSTGGIALNVRTAPASTAPKAGTVKQGRTVTITCQKAGQLVHGTIRTTTLWDRVNGGYVSDAYVATGSDGQVAPTCN